MQHKAGVYADNDAVLTDYTNNLKIDITTGGIYPFRQLRRARCGKLDPQRALQKQLVRLLAQTLSSGIDFRIKMKILATAWA